MTDELKVKEFINYGLKPIGCRIGDTLKSAKTIMLLNDFSQLPVFDTTGAIAGSITWKSVSKAEVINGNLHHVEDCMESPVIVNENENFLNHLEKIADREYILVVDDRNKLKGIITTYDMTMYFHGFITPYLRIGEIENRIRELLDQNLDHITKEEINEMVFSKYQRILEKVDNWEKVGFDNLDHKEFINKLNEIRTFRNRIAHYKPNKITSSELFKISAFAEFLTTVPIKK